MKRISEYLFCWALGGTLYYAVELLFRGYSHWSMFLLGGFCFLFFAWQGLQGGWKTPLWKQVLRCTVFVTSGEFITGIFVNKWMQWNVWDYSDQPFQLFGQICLPFTILFSGLCALGIFLAAYLLYWLYGEENHSFMCYKESVFYGKFVLILKTLPLKSNASCCTDHVFSS